MAKTQRRYKLNKIVAQVIICLVVLVLAVLAMRLLILMHESPIKEVHVSKGPLVSTTIAEKRDVTMTVHGYGTVEPTTTAQVVPQVSGKIVKVHKSLTNGGFFSAGEVLIGIDDADYRLAIKRANAGIAQAEVVVELETTEAAIAVEQWHELHPNKVPSSLLARAPQISQANAQLVAANAALSEAELALSRTVVSLPFDGRVVSKNVDIGQFIIAGQPVASVYGVDSVEIIVPIEDRELRWIDVPYTATTTNTDGHSPVVVTASFSGSEREWSGKVVRTEAEIDRRSRMVRVVVEVRDPFKVDDDEPPLVPGMFVSVVIEGMTVDDVIIIPRHALRGDDYVWVAGGNVLRIRKVEVLRCDREYAYITAGIEDGAVVVTSAIDTVVDGMTIRTPESINAVKDAEKAIDDIKPGAAAKAADDVKSGESDRTVGDELTPGQMINNTE